MVNIREIFTNRLQMASATSGVSQSEISRRLKVSRNTVNLWFNGKSWPEPETIDRMASFMGVTPTWLMGGGDTPITIPEALEVLNANAGMLAQKNPLVELASQITDPDAIVMAKTALNDCLEYQDHKKANKENETG